MRSTKFILYIGLLFIFLLPFQSCNDEEFLTESAESFYTVDNIFSSQEQVDQVLITLYRKYRNFRLFNYQNKGQGTDVLEAPNFRSSGNFSDYNKITPEASSFKDMYSYYYGVISVANTALNAAELESVTWADDETKNYAVAQARFFRAYAHGGLAELFGGVPIVTELATEPRYDYERSTREETYQYAIDELEAIVNDLPETTTQDGRVVRGAAQHYLAEFYLGLGIETGNSSAFDKAIEYASDVIDGGTYALMTERFGDRKGEEDRNVWWDLFRINNVSYNDGNTECIWSLPIDFDAFLAGDDGCYLNYPRYYMPVPRAIPGVTGVMEDVGGRGVAFYRPTEYVIDLIWDESISSNDIRNEESNIRRTIYYNDPNYDGGQLVGQVVPQEAIDAVNANGWIYPIFEKLTTDQFVGVDQGQDRSNLFRDEYAIRLPETILLRAEAYLRKGETQKAADDINMIRSRAHCDYLVPASEVSIDFILDERARELFTEESRWHTLLRMGGTVAVDRIRKYSYYQDLVNTTLTFDYNLWPIPQSVIDRNKDVVLEQNPGWN